MNGYYVVAIVFFLRSQFNHCFDKASQRKGSATHWTPTWSKAMNDGRPGDAVAASHCKVTRFLYADGCSGLDWSASWPLVEFWRSTRIGLSGGRTGTDSSSSAAGQASPMLPPLAARVVASWFQRNRSSTYMSTSCCTIVSMSPTWRGQASYCCSSDTYGSAKNLPASPPWQCATPDSAWTRTRPCSSSLACPRFDLA